MQKYFNNVTNRGGAVVPSASVTVTTLAGAAATIYSDNGSTVAANPIVCDANGYFEFYAADGRYTLSVSGNGIATTTITDVLLEDPVDGTSALAASGGSDLVGFLQAGTGAVARTLQSKGRDIVAAPDFGTGTAAWDAAAVLGGLVYAPKGAYALATAPSGNSVGFLMDGKATFSANTPPGSNDGTVFGASGQVLTYHAAGAGGGSAGSANEFTHALQMKIPVTGSAASYEKSAGYARIYTADPSTALIARDAVGYQHMVHIASTNALGRAWASHSYAAIEAGGDGVLYGHEIEVHNYGTSQASVDTTTSKYGLHVVARGDHTSTAGIVLGFSDTGLFEHGIYIKSAALNTNAIKMDGAAGGGFIVDKLGRVAMGASAAVSGIKYLHMNDASGVGGIYAGIESNSATAGLGAWIQFTKTATRNWNVGHDTATGEFRITTGGSHLGDGTRVMSVDGSGNIALMGAAGQFGNGTLVLSIPNASVVPTTNPTGGGVLYMQAGSAKVRTPSGNIVTYAPDSAPSVTGSRGANAALASLLTQLASLGFIANNTTA